MPQMLTDLSAKSLQDGIFLPDFPDFDLAQTLDCGQAFRWKRQPDGGFLGVAREKVCHISRLDSGILLRGVGKADFEGFWRNYFDLDRDYGAVKRRLSSDPVFARAVAYAPGIRVLRQDGWEALCSFIISQNNNVGRIKGIVQRLCETFGEPVGDGLYSFPGPERLAGADLEAFAPLRAGFRARYLLDAARKVASGEVELSGLDAMPLAAARETLMQITGVGVKVADCALLYGFGRIECFPVDVWIRRAVERLFPHGLPACTEGCAGIAQQYLFHYARTCPGVFEGDPA